jgi:SAM-dependent methyltransferase
MSTDNFGKGKAAVSDSNYGDSFYQSQMQGSYRSAIKYAKFLASVYKPLSVADVGCGRGTWLKAFKENGAERVVGFDGVWNTQEKMIDQAIVFHGIDLNQPIPADPSERFDLALSLEVAEHLKQESSPAFVKSLTGLADVVIFGAAYTKQGGTDHINEQPHTFWAEIFKDNGYTPYDLFRPVFWGDEEIEFWYRQNTFLYVKNTSNLIQRLANAGYQPIQNLAFMNCIHPALYNSKAHQAELYSFLSRMAGRVIPRRLLPLARRIIHAGT